MKTGQTSMEEKALDIAMGDEPTQRQLDELEADDELRACVQDALDARTATQRHAERMDVEARLRLFHARHTEAPATGNHHATHRDGNNTAARRQRRRLAMWIASMAAAAMFAGALFLVTHPTEKPTRQNSFTAHDTQGGISLVADNGDKVTLRPSARQTDKLTLNDFRNIFADESRVSDVTLTVPRGKSADITLPDSSVVSLSPGSQLTFPTTFGDRRVVKLDGSGYFKVSHDAARPFTVLTSSAETTVLGTEFAVDSKKSRVTLITGRVSVKGTTQARGTILRPSQQASLGKDGSVTVTEVDTKPFTMWRDGYLYFDNVELREIMLAIGDNFNKTIDFRCTKALHCNMRFIAERNAGLQAALRMMNRMEKVRVSLQGNTVVVEDM